MTQACTDLLIEYGLIGCTLALCCVYVAIIHLFKCAEKHIIRGRK